MQRDPGTPWVPDLSRPPPAVPRASPSPSANASRAGQESTHVCNDLSGRLSHGRSWEPEVSLTLRGAQSSGHTQRSLQVYDLLGGAWAKRMPCGHPGPISLSICLIYETPGGNGGRPASHVGPLAFLSLVCTTRPQGKVQSLCGSASFRKH